MMLCVVCVSGGHDKFLSMSFLQHFNVANLGICNESNIIPLSVALNGVRPRTFLNVRENVKDGNGHLQ